MIKTKQCSKCGLSRSAKHFYTPKSLNGGLSSRCKECTRAASRKYQERKRKADPFTGPPSDTLKALLALTDTLDRPDLVRLMQHTLRRMAT